MKESRNKHFMKESAQIRGILDKHREQAANTYVDLLKAQSEVVRRDVSREILNLGRHEQGSGARLEVPSEASMSIVIHDPSIEDDKLMTPEVRKELENLNNPIEEDLVQ